MSRLPVPRLPVPRLLVLRPLSQDCLSQDFCPKNACPKTACPKITVPRLLSQDCLSQDCLSQDYCLKTLRYCPRTSPLSVGTVGTLLFSLSGFLNHCTWYHHLSSSKRFFQKKPNPTGQKLELPAPRIYLPFNVLMQVETQITRDCLVFTCLVKTD